MDDTTAVLRGEALRDAIAACGVAPSKRILRTLWGRVPPHVQGGVDALTFASVLGEAVDEEPIDAAEMRDLLAAFTKTGEYNPRNGGSFPVDVVRRVITSHVRGSGADGDVPLDDKELEECMHRLDIDRSGDSISLRRLIQRIVPSHVNVLGIERNRASTVKSAFEAANAIRGREQD